MALLTVALFAIAFQEHTIATDLKGGYQVVAVDMNRDGRPHLIALASGMPDLVWFENPGWTRHVIARGMSRMINVAAHDIDRDGVPELILASEFANEATKSKVGSADVATWNSKNTVTVLRREGWTVTRC